MASQTPHRQAGASTGFPERRSLDDVVPLGSAPLPWEAAEKREAGEIAGAISTRVVGLLRRHTGRGPTKARTTISSDVAMVTLSGCLTTAERKVVAAGQADLVARARDVLYDGMRAEAMAIVEELTDSSITAYLAAQHDDPDLAILVFYLAPVPLRLA